jgi:hypothetical protein
MIKTGDRLGLLHTAFRVGSIMILNYVNKGYSIKWEAVIACR